MPKTRRHTVFRRLWMLLAIVLSGALHIHVLERLLHLNPQPGPRVPTRPAALEDMVFEFAALPPPVQPPESAAVTPVAKTAAPSRPSAARAVTPTRVIPVADVSALEYAAPELTSSDLLRQLPYTAAQSVRNPQETGKRWLDLGVRADPDGAFVRPERRAAGLGGAPVRADVAPVGDIANGMLIERWQDMHHGHGSLDCKEQPAGEPLSSYLARCRQGR